MFRDATIFRKLLTACLAASLAFASLGPVVVFAALEARPMSQNAQSECCCGSADGRCCGMTCCSVESPETPQNPVLPPERTESPRQLVVSSSWDGAATLNPSSSRFTLAAFEPAAPASETSLQDLQVRLDI